MILPESILWSPDSYDMRLVMSPGTIGYITGNSREGANDYVEILYRGRVWYILSSSVSLLSS